MIGQLVTLKRTTGYTATPEVLISELNLRNDVLKSFAVTDNHIVVETTDMQAYTFLRTDELEDELNELFNPEIKILVQVLVKLEEGAELPVYSSGKAAGADLRAYKVENISENCMFNAFLANNKETNETTLVLNPGGRALISTGISIELPEGYEAQIRPRSGLAFKHGISVVNSPGTIDADYTGILGVILINHGFEPFVIKNGERICQMVIAKHETASFEIVEALEETERGEGGFGHTGK